MTQTKAELKAKNKYNKAKTRTYCLRLNLKTDKDIIEILDSVTSKQGFIKALIRAACEEKDESYSNIAPVFRKYELGSYYEDRRRYAFRKKY